MSDKFYNSSYSVLVVCRKTSFNFLCRKDLLRITDGIGTRLDYCGNKTGQRLRVIGDKVELMFRSDDNVERRGYYLVFTLVSSGKWNHIKKLIKLDEYTKSIFHLNKELI